MPVYMVRHTRNVDIVTDYYVETDDEFFTEDEAIDAVIDNNDQKPLPKGVTVTFKQTDEIDYNEEFEAEEED